MKLTTTRSFLTSSTARCNFIFARLSESSTVIKTWSSSFKCSQFGFPRFWSSWKEQKVVLFFLLAVTFKSYLEFIEERKRKIRKKKTEGWGRRRRRQRPLVLRWLAKQPQTRKFVQEVRKVNISRLLFHRYLSAWSKREWTLAPSPPCFHFERLQQDKSEL